MTREEKCAALGCWRGGGRSAGARQGRRKVVLKMGKGGDWFWGRGGFGGGSARVLAWARLGSELAGAE